MNGRIHGLIGGVINRKVDTLGSLLNPLYVAYKKLVIADGGIINNQSNANRIITKIEELGLYDVTKVFVDSNFGVKTRDSGIYKYVSKSYSADPSNNHAVQSTESLQPLQTILEKSLHNKNGGTNYMTHPVIQFASNEPWTLVIGIRSNSSNNSGQLPVSNRNGGNAGIQITSSNNAIDWRESTILAYKPFSDTIKFFENKFLHLVYDGINTIKLYKDGVYSKSITTTDSVYFNRFMNASTGTAALFGSWFYYRIQSGEISAENALAEYNFRIALEEYKTINIGGILFALNNVDLAKGMDFGVIADGTVTGTWTTGSAAWCYHSGSNGLLGKLYNKSAKLIFVSNPPVGYHVSTEAELSLLLSTSGLAALLSLPELSSSRNADGTFNTWNQSASIWCADSDKVLSIDNADNKSIIAATANEGHSIRLVKDGYFISSINSFSNTGDFSLLTGATSINGGINITGDGAWKKNIMHGVDTYLENIKMDVSFRITDAGGFSLGIGRYDTQFGNSEFRITSTDFELRIVKEGVSDVLKYNEAHGLSIVNGNVLKMSFYKTDEDCTYSVTDGVNTIAKTVSKYGTSGVVDAYALAKMWGKPYIACTDGAVFVDGIKISSDYDYDDSILGIWGDSIIEGATMISSGLDNRYCALIASDLGLSKVPTFSKGGQSINATWQTNFESEIDWFDTEYVLIALGVNNSVFSSYELSVNAAISTIKSKGRIPILTTVTPRVDVNNNDFRIAANNFIRGSGERYVDIAAAVTVEGDESTWVAEYVQADGVHPTSEGHLAIYNRFKVDVPELF